MEEIKYMSDMNDTCAHRRWFIRDFMISSARPVSELPAFLAAYDSCVSVRSTDTDVHTQKSDTDIILEQKTAETKKTTRKEKFTQVIHSGTTPNVHPRAKMIAAEFEGRTEYYGSINAAAKRLGVTYPQMLYALNNNKLVHGYKVYSILKEELFKDKEPDELGEEQAMLKQSNSNAKAK